MASGEALPDSLSTGRILAKLGELEASIQSDADPTISEILLSELQTMRKILRAHAKNTAAQFPSGSDREKSLKTNRWLDWMPRFGGGRTPNRRRRQPHESSDTNKDPARSQIEVFLLGFFQVYQDDRLIDRWPNGKGRQIFKYLILKRKARVHKEVLMDLFWPSLSVKAARNNLNVNICGLRRRLPLPNEGSSHIVYEADCYFINPHLDIWVDTEAFDVAFERGRVSRHDGQPNSAVEAFEEVVDLYNGELLTEDRYDEWIEPVRTTYADRYLAALAYLQSHYMEAHNFERAIEICRKLIAADPSDEIALACLMACYQQTGKRHLAIREHHRFVERLDREYDLHPSPTVRGILVDVKCGRPVAWAEIARRCSASFD